MYIHVRTFIDDAVNKLPTSAGKQSMLAKEAILESLSLPHHLVSSIHQCCYWWAAQKAKAIKCTTLR